MNTHKGILSIIIVGLVTALLVTEYFLIMIGQPIAVNTNKTTLTEEEVSFVGSWQLVANTTNGSRILSNATFYYNGTYSQSQFVDNNSSGTWHLRKHTLLFSRQREGKIIDQPDDGGEVYWWYMLQQTTNHDIYNVTSFGRLYSTGKTEVWQFNQTDFTSLVMSRIVAS